MAVTIDFATSIISVPQADLTLITGTLYEMDTEVDFHQAVNALLDDEEGIVFDDAILHNTEISVAGVTYARFIEVINGYSVVFTPDTQWSVRLAGSNNNIFDIENGVLNQNQVQVIPNNSAGLQVVIQGSGVSAQDILDIAAAVWNAVTSAHLSAGTFGEYIQKKLLSLSQFIGLK